MTDKYEWGKRKSDDRDPPDRPWTEKIDDLLELNERILTNQREININLGKLIKSSEKIQDHLYWIKFRMGA